MVLHPAPVNHGIQFRRIDLAGRPRVRATWDAARPATLCTRIVNADGISVSTIEHIMAALAGCGVHNVLVDLDGPEVPILDGSAEPFVREILTGGLDQQDAPLRAVKVLRTVEVRNGGSVARIQPEDGLSIEFQIDFDDAAIGLQEKSLNLANGTFVHELCDSRTFCRQSDVDAMRAQGLALGGTYDNAVVVDGDAVLNPGGLRHTDEAVRHKMLDALGDLALAGMPVLGRYVGVRSGHAMTIRLLHALFADPNNYVVVECDTAMTGMMPGAGVQLDDLPAQPRVL